MPQCIPPSHDYISPRSRGFTPSGSSDPFFLSRSGSGTGKTTPSELSNPALTPPASSIKSEEPSVQPPRPSPYLTDDVRRLSVNSLLTQEDEFKKHDGFRDHRSSLVSFGVDRGLPDLDISRNDDARALEVVTPPQGASGYANDSAAEMPLEFGFGIQGSSGTEKKAGYTEPIQVTLSRTLLPLPSILLDNPMNLMYFHFFQEFTARILVPHDCPDNPFIKILPQSKSCSLLSLLR